MSAAALLLACALLISPRRHRVSAGGARRSPDRSPTRPDDPLAMASALDVLAVCLSSGMAVSAAASATAESAPPALRSVLKRAADLLALGADPDTAWTMPDGAPVGHSDGHLDGGTAALMRLARRSASSGSALAQGAAELAEQSRQEAAHAAAASAERAGVLIAGPLGLCFLPSFVCLGIVPVVAGLAGSVFGEGLL